MLLLYIIYFVWVGMGKHMHVCAHAHVIADVEIQGQLAGVSFLLPGD